MKTTIIKTLDGKVVAMLVQQAEQNDRVFNELVTALVITIANDTALKLTTETTQ